MYLNCHTHYSFRYGTLSVKDLLMMAQEAGIGCMALTDINNTSACMDFMRMAPSYGVKAVTGIDFRHGIQPLYIGLARNRQGFAELNGWLSTHLHAQIPLPAQAPAFADSFVIYPYVKDRNYQLRENEFVGIQAHQWNSLRLQTGQIRPEKLVMLAPISFRNQKEHNIHRLLRAIDCNVLLSKLSTEEQARADEILIPPDALRRMFAEHPGIIRNTEMLLEQCHPAFEFGTEITPKNPKSYTGSVHNDHQLIRRLCRDGLNYRYPQSNDAIHQRIRMELEIISQKGFLSYFLINWDITRYARSKGYFYVGRGSGANSIVAYLLRITDVDPVELDLYFERFINLYRKNPPDFDIDFSWTDRQDVTRYIFDRFPNTALLATYNTFQYRAIVRELSKVFGLPKHETDQLCDGKFKPEDLDPLKQLILRYAGRMQGMPSHLSIHAGGILISDAPMQEYTATWMPPKGFPTTQFDMVVAEDIGLYKFDILGQRGLGKIKDSVEWVRRNHPSAPPIDIHNIAAFKQDEAIKALLRKGRAIGCFYVESPAMRMLLNKLQVDHYLGLVAASSIIRPGVAKSGMMREYILRYRYPEKRKDAHPALLDIMPETFGVMVYQEDVIKVAHYFAGLSLGEADMLRRGMSGKFRSREEFAQVQQRFFEGCREKGHSKELAAEVWRQVESFAGYAFAKGHSASYAVESYQSLFLKAHYPLEYMVATVNNGGGFYRTELYLHEARMHGGIIHPPCVNRSDIHTLIEGRDIYLGLAMLQDLELSTAERLVQERSRNGAFSSLSDFMDRVHCGIEQLSILIRIQAFRFTGTGKQELLWKAHFYFHKRQHPPEQQDLFRPVRKDFSLPQLSGSAAEDAFDQIELLGFPLCSPFELLRDGDPGGICAADLPAQKGKCISLCAYLVTLKDTRTSDGKRMQFGTFLDRKGYFVDTVHFPPVAARWPFRGRGVYRIVGKVTEEFSFYTIEASELHLLPMMPDPRYDEKAPGSGPAEREKTGIQASIQNIHSVT